jgi:hypothetical protein
MAIHLIGREKNVVSEPLNRWWRIGFNVTLKISVKLKGLAYAFPNDFDGGRKLYFDIHVASCADADDISGDTVISTAMLLLNGRKLQNVALEDGSARKNHFVIEQLRII